MVPFFSQTFKDEAVLVLPLIASVLCGLGSVF